MTGEWSMQRIAHSRSQHGFTMVELVTVMIVTGILAVVALPNFSLLGGYNEVGYRDQVKATLEFARKAAVAQRRYSCVGLGSNTLTLTIDKSSPEGRSASACPREQNLILPGSSGNSISPRGSVTLTGPASVVFDAQGRPFAAATFTVGASTVVTVEAETGYVH
ncbi:MAG: prepilin-type N-terminal cleavage/methylation domain-containing protein [Proteobacteria bacterium]|nr:prepilin-type N-terminal cleavage/methylation domain-containing protein [Pseudomonadota bacterium]